MGNTESITNDHHHDNGKPQAGSRSRKILKKFEKMHSQKSPSQEESQVEPTTSSPEATDGRKNWLLQLDRENEEPDCPPLSGEYRRIIIRTWAIVEEHISQVGLSTFLELFRRAPESLHFFPFLKHLNQEDLEFYAQLRNHSVRVTGVLSMLVKQLEQEESKADERIKEFLIDLGRRHFSYGANTSHMELLGLVFVETLLPLFSADEEQEKIKLAWMAFFRLILFWLASGFRFVQHKGHHVM